MMCQNLHNLHALGDATNLCCVVMPDHFHLLIRLKDEPLQKVINRLKSRSAVLLNRHLGRRGRFWAPGYYDHAVRREENIVRVARYIVANPLRAGLVKRLGDYPYWNAVWL
jgi:REP element-mobilizing transposase RayT